MTKVEEFGQLLRAARKAAGLTLGELATTIGVSIGYLSETERGIKAPLTHDRLMVAARALETDPGPLILAAAIVKGHFALSADVSRKGQDVGARLAMRWGEFTDLDFDEIHRLLKNVGSLSARTCTECGKVEDGWGHCGCHGCYTNTDPEAIVYAMQQGLDVCREGWEREKP